jgi:hypothetical protein
MSDIIATHAEGRIDGTPIPHVLDDAGVMRLLMADCIHSDEIMALVARLRLAEKSI